MCAVRVAIIVVLAAVFAGVTFHAVRNPQPRWHGGPRWPWVSWTILLVLLVPMIFFEYQWWDTESTLDSEAKILTGRADVTVGCQRAGASMFFAGSESGHVMWEENDEKGTGSHIWLTYETCRQLRTWMHSGRQAVTAKDAAALHVFVHEMMHTMGEKSEAATECAALAADEKVFARFADGNVDVAQNLYHVYAAEVYPKLSSEYLTSCPKTPSVTLPGLS